MFFIVNSTDLYFVVFFFNLALLPYKDMITAIIE